MESSRREPAPSASAGLIFSLASESVGISYKDENPKMRNFWLPFHGLVLAVIALPHTGAGCETGIHNHRLYEGCVSERGETGETGERAEQAGDEGQKDLFRSASEGRGGG